MFAPFLSFGQNIPMTFHNGSFSPIYLSIPGVMNPNLSPKSNSGVSLDVGQVVYFFPKGKNGKKEILFTVSSTWKGFADIGKVLLQADGKINEALFTDGLHPKSAGYDKLGEKLEAVLKNN
jgi:hypothetical protein